MSFLYRDHRGLLDESMATVQEMADKTELEKHLFKLFGAGVVEVKYYAYDDRINWETYLVTHNGSAVGFTNGVTK